MNFQEKFDAMTARVLSHLAGMHATIVVLDSGGIVDVWRGAVIGEARRAPAFLAKSAFLLHTSLLDLPVFEVTGVFPTWLAVAITGEQDADGTYFLLIDSANGWQKASLSAAAGEMDRWYRGYDDDTDD